VCKISFRQRDTHLPSRRGLSLTAARVRAPIYTDTHPGLRTAEGKIPPKVLTRVPRASKNPCQQSRLRRGLPIEGVPLGKAAATSSCPLTLSRELVAISPFDLRRSLKRESLQKSPIPIFDHYANNSGAPPGTPSELEPVYLKKTAWIGRYLQDSVSRPRLANT
jgi:hypothetical protein